MRRGVTCGLGAAIMTMTAVLFLARGSAAEVAFEIEPIGTSTVVGDGAPKATTIWSIKVGKPEVGEQLAFARMGVDGVILTPAGQGQWKRGVHRSPSTAELEDGVRERPILLRRLESGDATLLPPGLRGIDPELVSEIVIYEAGGGMRINFKAGVSEERVHQVLRDLVGVSAGRP